MEKIKHELDLLPMVLRSKKRANGKVPLIVRITLNCREKEIPLKINILPENWNIQQKKVSKNEEEHKYINKRLREVEVDLKRIYDRLFLQYEEVTPLMIKRSYFGHPPLAQKQPENELSGLTLLSGFDEFINNFKKLVDKKKRSDGTYRQWKSTRKKVRMFMLHKYGKEDMPFSEITPNFADRFYDYLTIEAAETIADPTAKKHIKKTKQIIKIGVKNQLIPSNPIADFVCGGDQPDVLPLEWDQVESEVATFDWRLLGSNF